MADFLKEFREKNPAYNDMPDDALADALHRKFYADMPRAEFDKRIGLKPPAVGDKVETPGLLTGTVRALAKGASYNLADELAAAGDAAISPVVGGVGGMSTAPAYGQRYDENLRKQRAIDAAFRKENPLLSIGGEIVGTIGGTLATLPTAALRVPATLRGMVGQGALVGGGTGALAGFGGGEGGFQNRLLEAGEGALLGAGIGAAAPLVIVPAAKAGSWVRNTLGLQDSGKMAAAKTIQAFERDAIPLSQAADDLARLRAAGKPAAVMDVGGENVRGVARAAAGTPGPAKQRAVQILEARQGTMGAAPGAGQAGRVVSDAEKALGVQAGRFGQTFDDLLEQARAAAAPAYEKFHGFGPLASDKLDQWATNPVVRDALRKGIRIAQAEGDDLAGLGVRGFNEAGDPQLGRLLTAKGWDYAKRGLDDMIEAAKRGGETETVRALMKLKGGIVGEVDALTQGAYKAARDAYAGPMAMRDAMQLGRDVMKEEGGYQIAKQVKRLGDSEKQAFLQGVVEAIRDKALATGDTNNAVRSIIGKPILREKLRAAFPDDASYAQFLRGMIDEANLFRNAQAVSPRAGSMTDLRAAERADLGATDMLGDFTQSMVTGQSPVNALLNIGRAAGQRAGGMNAPTAGSLTDMLFSGDPAVIAALQAAQARGTPTMRASRYIGPSAGAVGDQLRR